VFNSKSEEIAPISRRDSSIIDVDRVLERYARVEQREYQKACIKDVVDALNDCSDTLIALPTGAGKTVVFSPIVAESRKNNLRTLVLGTRGA